VKHTLLGFSLLFTATTALAAPTAFQATYAVSLGGMTLGEMNASLKYSANGYSYQKLTKANGLAAILSGDTLTERSNGSKSGTQLLPQSYLHHHQNKRKDQREEFSFTTPTQVQGQYDGHAYQLTVPSGTVDQALLELHLMDDLPAGKPLNYQVVDRGKLHDYHFQKLGQETVAVPAGQYPCEKVQVTDNDRETTLWLAPTLGYAPVKVRHTGDGDAIETSLIRFQAQ